MSQLEELRKEFNDRPQITINEAAKYLHMDRRTLLANKKFPYRKVGSRYYVSLICLARWMEG